MSKPVKAAPWAYSKINAFEQCARQFLHEKVLKEFPFEETEAIIYGNQLHKAAELYVGKGEPLPERFAYVQPMIDSLLKKGKVYEVEQRLGLTADMQPCGFFDKQVWFRGIADLIVFSDGGLAWVIDYKTGKSARYADSGQLELMALCVFAHYPQVQKINAGLLYVVSEELVREQYTRDMVAAMWTKWGKRYERMAAAFELDVWNPSPSGLCRNHCRVLSCPHNGRS